MRQGPGPLHCCLLALLLAGCAGDQGPADGTAPAASAGPAAPASDPPYPERLELTGCTGWDGHSTPFPRATSSWPAPAGWEPKDPTGVWATVLMAGYECQRLSIGPFERGPIRLLYDGHNHVDVPPACLPSGGFTGDVAVLNSLWVDDDEVALYLRETLGLPARFSNITEEVQDGGTVRLRTWTWGNDPGRSTVTYLEDGTATGDLRPSNLFWARGEGIGSLALTYERQGSSLGGRPAWGTMQPPMLLSNAPQGVMLGMTKWYPQFPASGEFTRYADTLCTLPEA